MPELGCRTVFAERVYEFAKDTARVDRERVHRWLSEQSYWAAGRARETLDAAMAGSRNYGVYAAGDGVQVAFARVVTDGATFAWLCDVFVDEDVRGSGVGTQLMAGIVADLEPLGLKRVLLATADAHGLYAKFGFAPLANPVSWMAKIRPAG